MRAKVVLAAFAAVMMAGVAPAFADPQCVCDCNAECRCGEECTATKECKVIKKCSNTQPCSNEQTVVKCSAKKQLVCHLPPGNPSNAHTLCVGQSAVPAHLAHGDYLGQCLNCDDVCTYKTCCKWVTTCGCRACPGEGCPPCECPPPLSPDASMPSPDASVPDPDSHVPQPDSAIATPDSVVSAVSDSAIAEPDTAVAEPDAAIAEPDIAIVAPDSAAVAAPDATVIEPDSAPAAVPDSAFPESDAAVTDAAVSVPQDAGAVFSPDAGVAADLEIIESDGPCDCPDGFKEEKRPMELLGSGCQMGGSSGIPWGGLLITGLFGAALFLLRRGKTVLGILLAVGLLSGAAQAEPNLPASHLQPSVGAGDYYQTVSPNTLGHGKIALGAFYNYEHRPLQILWQDTGDRVTSVVRYRHNLDLLFAIGLGSRLELGLGVPFVLGQGTRGLEYLDGPGGEAFDGGIGDMRLSAKVRVLNAGPFAFGASASIVAPTASDGNAFGQGGFSGSLALLGEISMRFMSAALNAGISVSESDELKFEDQNIVSGSSFFGSLGVAVPVWRGKLDLVGDAFMSMNLREQDREEVPFEFLGGLRAHLGHGVTLDAGAGPGLTKGVGTPSFRVFAGLSWSPQPEKVRVKVVKRPWEECDRPIVTRKVTIVRQDTKVSIKLPELFPVFFATDKDEPLPQSLPVLKKNLSILKQTPGIKKVMIEGHTDWRASDAYNFDLAMRRAGAVRRFLVDGGIDPKRLDVVSYGESRPAATNRTKAGMAQNRRAELRVKDPKNGVVLKIFRSISIFR